MFSLTSIIEQLTFDHLLLEREKRKNPRPDDFLIFFHQLAILGCDQGNLMASCMISYRVLYVGETELLKEYTFPRR